ncbi:MAG: UDP-N-acetylmuramoyl-tripeptide--D-alanyl-D-alanine ligase [Clostridiales bacterium]|jgi:UDP-N-acetylmuramoyl-tripeptide--D-alanyl-D-alanine ligase|nr:UDP-N-acetylmuramoyl-tripeptide--D-alanyl-D-alanine ligase [Clostridiales bacterium]
MEREPLEWVAKAVGGVIEDSAKNIIISGVATDSRAADLSGKLFVPLKGKNADGHQFISEAFSKNAAACLTEKDIGFGNAVKVKNSAKALKDLAAAYRSLLDVKTVAVTGSVGKTAVKDFTAAALSVRYKTLKTEGNFNNEIGLPLTIFRLDKSHEYAVLEMGMSGFGEISELSRVARPNVCVITNIGYSHIENLKSRDGILRAKCEIFDYMDKTGKIILNGRDDMLSTLKKSVPSAMFYGDEIFISDVRPNGFESVSFVLCYKKDRIYINLPYPGAHMAENALAAAAVGVACGLDFCEIKAGLEGASLTKMRMDVKKTPNGVTIINDAYNSSPASVKSALSVLANADGRKVAVLGDMFELGGYSDALHAEIGRLAAKSGANEIIFVGKRVARSFAEAARIFPNARYFSDKKDFILTLGSVVKKGDIVLVKASRGMAFEEIARALETL